MPLAPINSTPTGSSPPYADMATNMSRAGMGQQPGGGQQHQVNPGKHDLELHGGDAPGCSLQCKLLLKISHGPAKTASSSITANCTVRTIMPQT